MENTFVIVGHINGLTAIRIAAIKAEFPDIVIVKQDDVQNLEWVTKQENVIHGYKSGFASNRGIKNGFSKLTEEQVLEIRKKKTEGFTHQQLANIYNVSYGCITGIIQRTNWKHI